MFAYLLSRASMWAKSPYMYLLYSTYHNFSTREIGILYLIDAACNVFSGPLMGFLADTFGRKLVSSFYPLNTITNLCLRMTGDRRMAYLAQFVTGIFGSTISTAFESWLNYEMTSLYGDDTKYIKHFRKRIFSE